MEPYSWRQLIEIGVVASLVLSLLSVGMGFASLTRSSGTTSAAPSVAPKPTVTIVHPSGAVTVSSTTFFDVAPLSKVTTIDLLATGGSLHGAQIATMKATLTGWLASWNTTTVANGTYQVAALAYGTSGTSSRSAPVVVTVRN
jgi:hypothetical protein